MASCSFVRDANEFKARGTIDLLFPFDLIPGLSSILPHVVLDLSGGFEWQNDEVKHRHEMEKLRLTAEIATKEIKNVFEDVDKMFLDALRRHSVSADAELRDVRERSEGRG